MLRKILSVCFLLTRYTKLSFLTRSSVFERAILSQLTRCNAIHVRAFHTVISDRNTCGMYPYGTLQVSHWVSRRQIDHYLLSEATPNYEHTKRACNRSKSYAVSTFYYTFTTSSEVTVLLVIIY